MTIEKKCQMCKEDKPLGEFFCASHEGRAAETRTGKFCRQCHAEGSIKNGYGCHSFGGKFATPEETVV